MFRLHYAPDNASLVIRLALDEMDLPFETVLIDRRAQRQKSAAYRALNPLGLIPTLETPQGAIFETAAILLWLSDDTGKLFAGPREADRGRALSWLFALSNGLHADLRGLFYPDRHAGPDHQVFTGRTRGRIRDFLDQLETLAGAPPGWFGGETPGIIDLYVVVMLRWLALYPVGGASWFALSDWPRLDALAKRVELRPSVTRAIAAEGLGQTPFSRPGPACPPEGSAT